MCNRLCVCVSSLRLDFKVKKEGWGGGGTRTLIFQRGQGDLAQVKPGGKSLTISIGDGLPKTSSESKGTAQYIRILLNKHNLLAL